MSCEIAIINIISAFIGAILIIYLFNSTFNQKISLKKKVGFVFTFSMVNGILSANLSSLPFKSLVLITLSILLIKFLLNVTLLHSFISFALYSISFAIGDALYSVAASYISKDILTESIQSNIIFLIVGNILTNALAFFTFILARPLKNYIKIASRNKFLYLLTASTIIVITSSYSLYYFIDMFNLFAYAIISAIITSYCIFTVLVWFHALKNTINEEEIIQQKFYNESLRSTLFELRRFKHDWANNLTVIHSMLKMNKITELKGYVSELISQNDEHGKTEIFSIKNVGLFGIISSKMSLAHNKGINVELNVIGEIDSIPGVKISELCEIIGIFLDNAIEGTAEGNDKTIEILLKNSERIIEISISNECAKVPDIQLIYKEGYSTKGENRGMGLAIAKKIIDRNKNILLTTKYENNTFTQTLEILLRKG